jgi:hypothetical protein
VEGRLVVEGQEVWGGFGVVASTTIVCVHWCC